MNLFQQAKLMFAAAIALAVGPMGKGLPASSLAGRYAGPFRTPSGTRKVAQDKRDATDEVALLSQVDPDFDIELCKRQLEDFRATQTLPFPQDHLPDAA